MDRIPRRDRERLMRENEMMDAAEKVFARCGYEKASVDEIATEAQYTRKTVYQHFQNKEDLYMAVVVRGFKQLLADIQKVENGTECGLDKLKKMGMAYYRFHRQHANTFRLMSLVGYIKSKGVSVENNQEFEALNGAITEEMAGAVNEGKQDGSVRNDVNTAMSIYAAQFLITGFFNQLSISGETFTKHCSIDQKTFSDFCIGLIYGAFKA